MRHRLHPKADFNGQQPAYFGRCDMIRFLLRFVGLLLLALGFIFLVYDGIRSISDGSILLTRTSEVWNVVHDRSLAAFQALVERYAGPALHQHQLSGQPPSRDDPDLPSAHRVGHLMWGLPRPRRHARRGQRI